VASAIRRRVQALDPALAVSHVLQTDVRLVNPL
jgi:hypothetical protein